VLLHPKAVLSTVLMAVRIQTQDLALVRAKPNLKRLFSAQAGDGDMKRQS
jgi:hypothetical protein